MSFMWWIIDRLSDIGMWFYDVAVECWDSFYIPNIVGNLFFDIHDFFVDLAWDFVDFDDWLEWAVDEIGDILSWSFIRSKIREWLDDIENLVDWWADWWNKVTDVIGEWWDSTRDTVRGWIDIAVEGLMPLLEAWNNFWNIIWPEWTGKLDTLKAAWDNFWTETFPTLISQIDLETWWNSRLEDIELLFETWKEKLAPFWEGWQEIREEVELFFADPLEWLWARFTDWFLGPEE